MGMNTSHCCVPSYVEKVQKCFKEAYAEAQHQSYSEVDRQKHNYDKSMSTVQLMPWRHGSEEGQNVSKKKEGERLVE